CKQRFHILRRPMQQFESERSVAASDAIYKGTGAGTGSNVGQSRPSGAERRSAACEADNQFAVLRCHAGMFDSKHDTLEAHPEAQGHAVASGGYRREPRSFIRASRWKLW